MLVFHLFFLARQIPIDMMIEYSVRPYNLFQTRVIQLEKKNLSGRSHNRPCRYFRIHDDYDSAPHKTDTYQ